MKERRENMWVDTIDKIRCVVRHQITDYYTDDGWIRKERTEIVYPSDHPKWMKPLN